MNEITLLKQFILNSPAKNSEHIQAIGWLNNLEQRIQQLQTEVKDASQNEG